MRESVQAWGVGGRLLWIGLALTYVFMLRASERFANGKGVFHKVCCVRRGGVAFFRDNELAQLVGSRIHEANKVR